MDIANLNGEDIYTYAETHYGTAVRSEYWPPPTEILGSNAPLLNRIGFEMSVISPTKEDIHRYTSIQTDIARPQRALEEIRDWRTMFPRLEDYYEKGQLDSEIIMIDSNLNLLASLPPKGSHLSTCFKVNIAAASGHDKQWSAEPEYYENNGQPVDLMAFYTRNKIRRDTHWEKPIISQGPASSEIELEIPMQSAWWVQLFFRMAAHRQAAEGDARLMQQEDEWSRRYLEELSVMQEVWVTSGSEASRKRVAIILWRFSQTRGADAGLTTWRRLTPPPKRCQVNSPIQSPTPPLQYSMVLDSTLENIAMPQPVSVHAERFLHQQSNIFSEDSEQIVGRVPSSQGSPSPALSPEYTASFPSSTTTSFPPSVTHGYLSHEESLDSACYSQESHLYRQDSFASQSSLVYTHESNYRYKEAETNADDLNYFSQNPGLMSQDPAYYSQQSLDAIPHFRSPDYEPYDEEPDHEGSNNTHDFSAGHIQLSFHQHDGTLNPYPPPYIAPSSQIPHTDHPPQADDQIGDQEVDPTIHDFPHHESDPMSAQLPPHADFDFSALETHFTSEELAAIRSQDFDEYQVQTTIKCAEQSFVMTAEKHSSDTVIEQDAEHGAVLGEVVDEDIVEEDVVPGADEGFGFEEVEEENQAVDGQRHTYSVGDGHDFDEVGQLDHL